MLSMIIWYDIPQHGLCYILAREMGSQSTRST